MGPVIGGALARPCQSFPSVFPPGTIFDSFPFLLPNLVCAAILAVGVLVGVLFLEETHEEKKYRRDIGLEAGCWISGRVKSRPMPNFFDKADDACFEESRSLMEDGPPPGYCTTEGSPRYPASRSHSPSAPLVNFEKKERPRRACGVEKAFTRQVVIHICGYGILA